MKIKPEILEMIVPRANLLQEEQSSLEARIKDMVVTGYEEPKDLRRILCRITKMSIDLNLLVEDLLIDYPQ